MAMQINTNLGAMNAQLSLNRTSHGLSTSMERLSSGLRINSAKDDAAGLAITDKMTSQIRGMTVAARNANDGISMAQTAEAGMGNITDTLQRMRDLAVQAANFAAVSLDDRKKLGNEFTQLGQEVSRIINNTEFNGKKVLHGSLAGVNFQIGANVASNNQISITVSDLAVTSGISQVIDMAASTGNIGSVTSTRVRSVISAIDGAIAKVDKFRSTLGAVQNRFTTTIANLNSSIENQSAARSRILDTDFATETAALSRNQILQQAGTAMLAQANQSGQQVLSLLR